jgi:hypothetical protein
VSDCRETLEVLIVASIAEHVPQWPADEEVPTEELARRQGVGPVGSVSQLAHPDLWDSDEDYEQFLAELAASRRLDVG